jgi:hypothetical protein
LRSKQSFAAANDPQRFDLLAATYLSDHNTHEAGFASGKLHSFRMPGRSPLRGKSDPYNMVGAIPVRIDDAQTVFHMDIAIPRLSP